ncbi:hypothetical protein DPMN_093113 [Dreissena polymorpha]|uniref:Uncharacterized protein n=1 Tax=Dreissena polymorpha TaxID=45954 RepID=A0A9D4L2U0_DREPO|nr:hypothetical protein DPMN_093113 [Dreissena polymorpha]
MDAWEMAFLSIRSLPMNVTFPGITSTARASCELPVRVPGTAVCDASTSVMPVPEFRLYLVSP